MKWYPAHKRNKGNFRAVAGRSLRIEVLQAERGGSFRVRKNSSGRIANYLMMSERILRSDLQFSCEWGRNHKYTHAENDANGK
jgi:hypothetical protein